MKKLREIASAVEPHSHSLDRARKLSDRNFAKRFSLIESLSKEFPQPHPGRRSPGPILKMISGPEVSLFKKKKSDTSISKSEGDLDPKADSDPHGDSGSLKGRGSSRAAKTLGKYPAGTLTKESVDFVVALLEETKKRIAANQRIIKLPKHLGGVFPDVKASLEERWQAVHELTQYLHDIRRDDISTKVRAIISSIKGRY
jgi:hypothetical protein